MTTRRFNRGSLFRISKASDTPRKREKKLRVKKRNPDTPPFERWEATKEEKKKDGQTRRQLFVERDEGDKRFH